MRVNGLVFHATFMNKVRPRPPCETGVGLRKGLHLLVCVRVAYIHERRETSTPFMILIRTPDLGFWATVVIHSKKMNLRFPVSVLRTWYSGILWTFVFLVWPTPGALM